MKMEIVAAIGSTHSETPSGVSAWAKNFPTRTARLDTGTDGYLARDSNRTARSVTLPHVLVIDEDARVRESIADYLEQNELRVTSVESAEDMRKAMQEHAIDLVVLDLCWWGADGVQHAWALREQSAVPIIIVSDRKHEADRVMGLESGADDYLTKPFSLRELLARLRALLRRSRINLDFVSHRSERRAYRFAGWELNLRTRRLVAPGGSRIALSNGDFRLLEALCCAPQRVLSRDQLLDLSRLHNTEVYDRAIDVQILRLRRRIEADPSKPVYIKTQRGQGYLFDVPVEVVHL
jgi:DNA-binding response OmpR family regulator